MLCCVYFSRSFSSLEEANPDISYECGNKRFSVVERDGEKIVNDESMTPY